MREKPMCSIKLLHMYSRKIHYKIRREQSPELFHRYPREVPRLPQASYGPEHAHFGIIPCMSYPICFFSDFHHLVVPWVVLSYDDLFDGGPTWLRERFVLAFLVPPRVGCC